MPKSEGCSWKEPGEASPRQREEHVQRAVGGTDLQELEGRRGGQASMMGASDQQGDGEQPHSSLQDMRITVTTLNLKLSSGFPLL